MDISSLWDGSALSLPPILADGYQRTLETNGLTELAKQPRPKEPPVGGHTQEQTDLHFAHAFDGSSARVELVYLNPRGETNTAAEIMKKFSAGGSVCIVDVPSGAGAGALTILTSVAELRRNMVLPRQRLEVRILWGEISVPARAYAEQLLAHANQHFLEQAIFVSFESRSWDVLDQVSNVALIERVAQTKLTHPQILLLVCSFSGFLERHGKWKAAQQGLSMLVQFCSGDMNAGVWIEPGRNHVSEGLFAKLGTLLGKLFAFGRVPEADVGGSSVAAKFHCPLGTGRTHRVNAHALPFELAVRRVSE